MKTLETERLILRKFKQDDLDDFYEYSKNPNVGNNAGFQPNGNKDIAQEILNSFIEHDNEWAIVYKENNKVIGSISMKNDVKRTVANANLLGYSMSEDYWGRGIMTEVVKRVLKYAFEDAGSVLVSICHFPFNERSRRVIEKCGFVFEGRLRSAYQMYNGEIYDDMCYSILREEYFLNNLAKS